MQTAAAIKVEVVADLGQLDQGLRRVEATATRSGERVANELTKVERAAGTATTATQRLAQGYDRLGTGAGSLTSATARMTAANDNAVASFGRMSAALGALGFVAVAAAALNAVSAIAKAGDEFTGYTNRLRAAGEDQSVLNRRMTELTDIAMRSRTSLAPVVDLYSGISKSTQDLGKSQADVARVTETISKAFATNSTSAASASGAILQLNQAFAAGALRGDELNSVMEGAPALARLIASEFGISVGELKSFGEEGKLSAERVFEAFLKGSKEIDSVFGSTVLTISQASTNAGTALGELGAAMDALLGISARVAQGLAGVAAQIRGVTAAVVAFGDGRKVGDIATLQANVGSYERQISELQGKNDFASKNDVANLQKRLAEDRAAIDKLVGTRVGEMVGPAPTIRLNAEGNLTTERAARTAQKAMEDLKKAETDLARDGMDKVQKATLDANKAFEERGKIAAKMRADGVENSKIAEFESRSQKILAGAIKLANEEGKKSGGGGASKASTAGEDAFQRALVTARGRTEQIEAEIRLQGQAGAELEASKLRIDLETAAKKRGLEVSEAMRTAIDKEVDARRRASQALAESKLRSDLQFERDQLGRSESEQRIASKFRSTGVPLDGADAEFARMNEALKETKDLLDGAAKGFISDIRAGKSAAEALANVTNRIADKLLDMALNQAISGLFGGKSGGGLFGGLIGSFFGGGSTGASGTYGAGGYTGFGPFLPSATGNAFGYGNLIPFARGGAFTNSIVSQPTLFPFANGTGLMGEAGPEAIMPLRRNASGELGVVIAAAPPANSNAAPAGDTYSVSIDARGATVDAVEKLKREIPGMVIKTFQEARRNRVGGM